MGTLEFFLFITIWLFIGYLLYTNTLQKKLNQELSKYVLVSTQVIASLLEEVEAIKKESKDKN